MIKTDIVELEIARKRQGLSRSQLARKAEISASHMAMIERGKSRASRKVALRIAAILDVEFDKLFSTDISKIVAIIPAHNEEQDIGKTLQAILDQPLPADRIIVALDNCTDGTEAEVKKHPGIRYFHTRDNKAKKAGALNQAIRFMLEHIGEPEYILQMDADTLIDENMIQAGVDELTDSPGLAGVCNRFRVKDYSGGSKFLYLLQSLEYSFYDSIWVERNMDTHVLSGTAVILRWEALKHLDQDIWEEDSIVEDFRLALDLKAQGWNIKVGKKMFSRTDYMKSLKELWNQRKRWFYGTVEELLNEGWTSYTKKDITTQIYSAILGGVSIVFFVLLITMITLGLVDHWHWLGQVLIAVIFIDKLYRSKYIKNKTPLKIIVNLSILPSYFYSVFLTVCYYYSAFLALSGRPLKNW